MFKKKNGHFAVLLRQKTIIFHRTDAMLNIIYPKIQDLSVRI